MISMYFCIDIYYVISAATLQDCYLIYVFLFAEQKMPQRRDNAGAVCNSGMGMLFLCIYFFYIISLRGGVEFFFDA